MILEIEKHDVMIRSANLKDESYRQKRVYSRIESCSSRQVSFSKAVGGRPLFLHRKGAGMRQQVVGLEGAVINRKSIGEN